MNRPSTQFQNDASQMAQDAGRREFLRSSLDGYSNTRKRTESRFQSYEEARQSAADIKWRAIENLAENLERFEENLLSRGAQVHWCRTGEEARQVILDIVQSHDANSIIKSKCMTTEEIHLNELLEQQGFEVVESDLGEFIVQLREEVPYHFVFPAMHLKKEEISKLFQEKLNGKATTDPEELTMFARQVLREKYIAADIGITGANFGVAENGMISITENEGNARLTFALPKVHIALMGIEKVISEQDELGTLLPMLATAGTGQHLTCYNSQLGGPRQEGESDGPEEMHVILLDNMRTALLADPEQRDALRCIRCGACLNVCPVFKNVGGHTYGTTYQGPIGSVITPHLRDLGDWKHLSHASSLCGACTQTCPVKIDLHHHLMRNRRNAVSHGKGGWAEWLLMQGFVFVMRRPTLYRFCSWAGRIAHKLSRPIHGSWLDPARAWRKTRDLDDPAPKSFKQLWKERSQS